MSDRILTALQWLASEISVTRDEFLQAQHPSGDMLFDGVVGNGYAQMRDDRLTVSDAGWRKLEAA